jgi:hypothetical protein
LRRADLGDVDDVGGDHAGISRVAWLTVSSEWAPAAYAQRADVSTAAARPAGAAHPYLTQTNRAVA